LEVSLSDKKLAKVRMGIHQQEAVSKVTSVIEDGMGVRYIGI
jgi:hypothetical protein